MRVKELIEYLGKSDPEATIYVETETHRLEAINILEDRKGIYISSEE